MKRFARARGFALAVIMAVVPASGAPPASGQIAPLHRERLGIIADAYRSAFGREPSESEVYWWVLYPETPPGIIDRSRLFAVLLQTLRNSPEEREATARRALSAAFASEEAGNPALRAYIEDSRHPPLKRALAALAAERDGGGFRGLVHWLARPDVHKRFLEETGMAAVMIGGSGR